MAGVGKRYLVSGRGEHLPASLPSAIRAAGGRLEATLSAIGLAIASSHDARFAARLAALPGIDLVVQDTAVEWVDPTESKTRLTAVPPRPRSDGGGLGAGEPLFTLQWAPRSISAPAAWDFAGQRGRGVRVAIIDGGIYDRHVDVEPNLDKARSRSFALDMQGNPTAYNDDVGDFWHGTHVAGIVAAPANRVGTIGIAPSATLIGVKAVHGGVGEFSSLIQAIVYSATPIAEGGAGADVINLSLGARFPRQGRAAAQLAALLSRATNYAYQRGVIVFASAGNDGIDFDHAGNLVTVPAMSTHVLAISATGPVDFLNGGTNFTRPASYTNFGQSLVAFAAPGGDFTRFDEPGWFSDMVLGPCRGDAADDDAYCFAAGTSMAAPAAAGVGALIVGKFGRIRPAQVEARLRASADDLGKRGNDHFYGLGFVNAFRAVN